MRPFRTSTVSHHENLFPISAMLEELLRFGLSAHALAQHLGTTQYSLIGWRRGTGTFPSADKLERMIRFYLEHLPADPARVLPRMSALFGAVEANTVLKYATLAEALEAYTERAAVRVATDTKLRSLTSTPTESSSRRRESASSQAAVTA